MKKFGCVFGGAHEGIITNHLGFAKMCDFICLKLSSKEREDIYSAKWCIEEFIIHTILNIVGAQYTNITLSVGEKGKKNEGLPLEPLFKHYRCTKKILI